MIPFAESIAGACVPGSDYVDQLNSLEEHPQITLITQITVGSGRPPHSLVTAAVNFLNWVGVLATSGNI
jgi:hypothetical protein